MRTMENLLEQIELYNRVAVTNFALDNIFCAPYRLDPFVVLAYTMNDHRPPETQLDLIDWFCKANNLNHFIDPVTGHHIFNKKALRPPA